MVRLVDQEVEQQVRRREQDRLPQDEELEQRLDPDAGAQALANYLHAVTMEASLLAKACGKSDVHSLEPEDMRALTLEASAMTGVPLVGVDKVFKLD